MANVLCLLPETRFIQSRVQVPAGVRILFSTNYEPAHITAAARTVEILFCPPSHPLITADIIQHLTHLHLVQSTGAGFDSIDHQAAARFGIPVANSPGMNATTVAELVFMFITAFQRNVLRADRAIKAGRYRQIRETLLTEGLLEMEGVVVGILGLGAIGRAVALRAQSLGAKVVGYDPFWPDEFARQRAIPRLEVTDLLITSDIVTVHCPLLPETHGLLGKKELRLMKSDAVLINTARGGVVDEQALARVLEEGHLRGAAIDNFQSEIPQPDNPLLNLSPEARDRALFTPHIAGVTRQAFARMVGQGLENIARVLAGEKPRFVVNGVD